ncbi:MAG: hypothetical protein ACI849_000770 [Patiriisocius sp.]|jgi:hypothetical protein
MKIVYVVVMLLGFLTLAQDVKFGEVSIQELKEARDAVFPEANAKVIYREIDFKFGEVLYVFERIKIYNREGFKHAKWDIDFDDVESLKAYTHNLEGGQIVSTKVSKESIFKEDIGDGYEVSKISFPNVKVGSVLELKYKVRGLDLRSLNTQATIPIKDIFIILKNPFSYELKITENPLSKVNLNVIQKPFELRYTGKNIKAMKEEKFIASNSTYLGKIYIEQVTSKGKNKLDDWKDVTKVYNKWEGFGQELKKSNYFKDDLEVVLSGKSDALEKAKAIYFFLQDRMQWSFFYAPGSESVRKAYKDKTGSVGDINLILTAMLRKAGLEANPVLIASLRRGYVLFPTVRGFNNTIAALELDGKTYLLDASTKYSNFGEIRNSFINGNGLIVYEDDNYKLIPTAPARVSKIITLVSASLDLGTLTATGDVKSRLSNYAAYEFRNDFVAKNTNAYSDFLKEEHPRMIPTEIEIKELYFGKKPITLSYNFLYKDCMEVLGDKIYLEPLLFFGITENNFNETERVYPIDFRFPVSKTYTLNISLPDGYTVEDLPESKNITIQDGVGSFKFNNTVIGNKLQISLQVDINNALVNASYYEGFKTLFTEYLKVSQSKIVLSK